MNANQYILNHHHWGCLLKALHADHLYATVNKNGHTQYQSIAGENVTDFSVNIPPPIESIKSFFMPASEKVAAYSTTESSGIDQTEPEIQIILGARACDLAALKILDKVFLDSEFSDPFYQQRRQNTIIITTDCIQPADYCFCNLVGGQPFAENGFDINISPLDQDYLLTVGSDEGKRIIDRLTDSLESPQQDQLELQNQKRTQAQALLDKQNQPFSSKECDDQIEPRSIDDVCRDANLCVECGGCSFICPTCHCFLLFDQRGQGDHQFERIKAWDSCILSNFAKMAGVGGNKPTPRPELRDRFENRIRHKFEWMMDNLNIIGCVGCGRCEAACMGGSDIRQVLKDIAI